ncbi:MAG: hypothetical protein AMXMBFR33_01630 [Candidatus Xenobia bacterium]
MSSHPRTRLLRLATALSENAAPDSPEFALAEAAVNYLHRPLEMHSELLRIRDKLARRLYSPDNERDVSALLELLTDKLSDLETEARATDWKPSTPDEWNRTHLEHELKRVQVNLDRWQPLTERERYAREDLVKMLQVIRRADAVIAGQEHDLGQAQKRRDAVEAARLATERELQDLRDKRTREVADAMRVGWDAGQRSVLTKQDLRLADVVADHLRSLK